jgi:hypothetical protein
MLNAVRDRVPRVEQFAALGNLHGKSSESVDFALYARVPPEQPISPHLCRDRSDPIGPKVASLLIILFVFV